MTPEQVKARVEAIRAMADDDEMAHSAEDGLRDDVLRYIAEHSPIDAAQLAAIALETDDIEFARWCA